MAPALLHILDGLAGRELILFVAAPNVKVFLIDVYWFGCRVDIDSADFNARDLMETYLVKRVVFATQPAAQQIAQKKSIAIMPQPPAICCLSLYRLAPCGVNSTPRQP